MVSVESGKKSKQDWGILGKIQDCIKRRAVLSVSSNPICKSPEEAEKVVSTVWNSCLMTQDLSKESIDRVDF